MSIRMRILCIFAQNYKIMSKHFLFITFFLLFGCVLNAQMFEPVKWKCNINESGEIVFYATVEQGWYLYDMNLPEGGPIPTTFEFEEIKGAELVGKVFSNSKIISKYEDIFEMDVRKFTENPTFIQKLKITDKNNFLISGSIEYMSCNDGSCIRGTEDFKFTSTSLPANLKISNAAEGNAAQSNTDKEATKSENPESDSQVSLFDNSIQSFTPESSFSGDYWKPVITELQDFGNNVSSGGKSWLLIFLISFGGGLLALLTPLRVAYYPDDCQLFSETLESKP